MAAPVYIDNVHSKERAVFAADPIKMGQYVCKYKTTAVYPTAVRAQTEAMYAINDEPCLIFDVQTAKGWFCLDATRRYTSTGRLMNHAAANEATVKPFRALWVDNRWKVSFLAICDIVEGEELTWDYGCPPKGEEWLMQFVLSRS